jgi:hypothetical protein
MSGLIPVQNELEGAFVLRIEDQRVRSGEVEFGGDLRVPFGQRIDAL